MVPKEGTSATTKERENKGSDSAGEGRKKERNPHLLPAQQALDYLNGIYGQRFTEKGNRLEE